MSTLSPSPRERGEGVRAHAGPAGKADRYERLYPGTGIPEAQKQERMERIDFKAERNSLRRTGRQRGIVIPAASCFDEHGRLRP